MLTDPTKLEVLNYCYVQKKNHLMLGKISDEISKAVREMSYKGFKVNYVSF